VAGKKIYINENFAKWEGLLPHRSRPSPYPLRQIYFSLGLSNNQEKLQLVPVFDDNPSNQWRETKSQITAPEGFRWLTNESEIVLEVVNESLKLDDEPLYYEILQRSTNRQLLNSARQPNLPPKAIEFLAQHKNRSVRDTLAQNPTISSDVLKVYSLKKLQKDDVMNRSKDGKRVRASMAKQQKRQGQQQRKNRGPKR
jgi:hypothetical protein